MEEKKHKVFVYGTLRKDSPDPTIYYIPGMAMFHLGHFPAVAENRYYSIVGQIVEVDDEQLAEYDRYEGIQSGFYKREEVIALRKDGEPGNVTVWVYTAGDEIIQHVEQQWKIGVRLRIPSGDWYEANEMADFLAKV